MKRICITELEAAHWKAHKREITRREAVAAIFKGDKTRPYGDRPGGKLDEKSGLERLSRWNNGRDLTSLRLHHILRIAALYKERDVLKIFEA